MGALSWPLGQMHEPGPGSNHRENGLPSALVPQALLAFGVGRVGGVVVDVAELGEGRGDFFQTNPGQAPRDGLIMQS